MEKIEVHIKKGDNYGDLPLPSYATMCSAGMDLYAAIEDPIIIKPGDTKLISSGIHIALPNGYEAQIRPRSGLALKHGISIVNTPGTVDADYRGPIGIILINHGKNDFTVARGERIAQMVINKVAQANWIIKNTLDETERGEGGYGHTGGHNSL